MGHDMCNQQYGILSSVDSDVCSLLLSLETPNDVIVSSLTVTEYLID